MSLGRQLFYFMFGMAIIYFPQTRGDCSLKHQPSSYELCATNQDGLNFECFGKNIKWTFEWYCSLTSLNDSSENSSVGKYVSIQDGKTCWYQHNKSAKPMTLNNLWIYKDKNITVHVFDKNNCTKASFRGVPKQMIRCDPPANVSFLRLSRRLMVNLTWRPEDERHIKKYDLRYRVLNSVFWNESQSTERNKGSVEHLDPSLSYEVEIRCSPIDFCPKCSWSPPYLFPPELTVPPVILNVEDDVAGQNGCRLLLIRWNYPSRELVKGYSVKVEHASGEGPSDPIPTDQMELRLIVSYSAYQLQITASNEFSTSPAAHWTVPARRHRDGAGGRLNVTFHSNMSLTLSWSDSEALKPIVCYSVELSSRVHKPQYYLFYLHNASHQLISLKEPLEPYQMYDITLHTRTNKNVCNMERINNSESTYGSLQAYFREGAPVSAPTNISRSNVTLTSMVLTWRPVPVEDLRGHLLGYTLLYKETGPQNTSTPRNTTVDPTVVSQELVGLESGTVYTVQIAAFTSAGAGVKSSASYFGTSSQGLPFLHKAVKNSLITCSVLIGIILFGSPLLKRAKGSFWPNVPNPGTSSAIQRMVKSYELEPLKLTILREECDTCTLHLPPPDPPLGLQYTGLQGSGQPLGTPLSCEEPPRRDASDDSTGDTLPDDERTTTPDALQGDPESAPGKGPSDYTTMELFQQGMPPPPPACRTEGHAGLHGEEMNKTVHGNGSGYSRQSSQGPMEIGAL
ncbi:protein sidekick-1 isoform X1 [Gadus chalcogrammus]|uniref:protein sidekick-1 isoform X1 n=2 Tax=Gadus chalcogrammus TaxID=1042646 RepID=UPI0024C3BD8C|nr:protein sidekick-1 isoform X1 [Gadus chalcogrammus]